MKCAMKEHLSFVIASSICFLALCACSVGQSRCGWDRNGGSATSSTINIGNRSTRPKRQLNAVRLRSPDRIRPKPPSIFANAAAVFSPNSAYARTAGELKPGPAGMITANQISMSYFSLRTFPSSNLPSLAS